MLKFEWCPKFSLHIFLNSQTVSIPLKVSKMDHHPYRIQLFISISISLLFSISALELQYSDYFTDVSDILTPAAVLSDKCSTPTNRVDDRVKSICNATDYPELCIITVTPFLKDKFDVLTVLKIAMDVGMNATEAILSTAKEISRRPGIPPVVVSILKECEGFYDTAVYNYERAIDALPPRDMGTMNIMLSAVITDVGDCDDAFAGRQSPLLEIADRVTKMTSNCLAIVSQLH